MALLLISFVAGVLTVLAPCILPILPVIVGRSITDPKVSIRRLLIVILSLGVSVIVFTLLLKASTLLINIPQDFWKWFSGGIIFIFGLVTIFPNLWGSISLTGLVNRKSNESLSKGYQKNNIWGDILVGVSLGPIFSTCSPTYFVILATVLPVSISKGIIYLISYCLGLCLALLLISVVGQRLVNKLGVVSNPEGWFKKFIGVLFILVGIFIVSGYDKKLQTKLLDAGFFDVTKIEEILLNKDIKKEEMKEKTPDYLEEDEIFLSPLEKERIFSKAPEISSPDYFINTNEQNIFLSEFKGKSVVLLDIWTYSCINCQRTIPYLNDWYEKYKDQGLVIVGLHTPEFSFERVKENVEKAVNDFNIKYPVVMDNDFSTWNEYGNRYWPRKYLIDIDGYIVYDHPGEGAYDETELQIQRVLKERENRLGQKNFVSDDNLILSEKTNIDFSKIKSPEIYFGSERNIYLSNGERKVLGEQELKIPSKIKSNELYLDGRWFFSDEYAENYTEGRILFKYNAKDVYIVGSSKIQSQIGVYLDGVFIKTLEIKKEGLYELISGSQYGEHVLEIKLESPGVRFFTFTFG